MSATALPVPYSKWRLALWRHPESWALLLSAGAWLFFFAARSSSLLPTSSTLYPLAAGAGHIHHQSLKLGSLDGWRELAFRWLIMIAAMMFPLLIGQLRVVAARSFWSRRNRAMALFLCGYSSLWLLFGLAAEVLLQGERSVPHALRTFFIPFCFLAAAFWQLTSQKSRSLVACHFTMALAPSGWRADLDCWLYGFRTAVLCCLSCWILMFACAAAGHALWAMLAVVLVTWSERMLLRPRQLWLFLALCTVALLASWPLLAAGT